MGEGAWRIDENPIMQKLHADLCLFGDESQPGQTLPVFAMREGTTKMMLAAGVPSKSSKSYIAKRVAFFIKRVRMGGAGRSRSSGRTAAYEAVSSCMRPLQAKACQVMLW